MKITEGRDATLQMIQQYQKSEAARDVNGKGALQGPPVPEEKVDISSRAKEYGQIKRIVDGSPEVREERIQELQRRIDNGVYRIPAEDVLKKMVGENLLDLFA
ncbi:MAG: flagellar biosynthesis anti-sigma factor FlgM [Pseudomonadota bacterium]|nr:flagellar biosynthesis anti-sigma factor FlgM [Pseudomonadota bacterium]